jgi:hypothetical protein
MSRVSLQQAAWRKSRNDWRVQSCLHNNNNERNRAQENFTHQLHNGTDTQHTSDSRTSSAPASPQQR